LLEDLAEASLIAPGDERLVRRHPADGVRPEEQAQALHGLDGRPSCVEGLAREPGQALAPD
jgi:hypothetical protein